MNNYFERLITIAEISGNHKNNYDDCAQLIDRAQKSGFSHAKLQTFTADGLTINSHKKEFIISDKSSPWHNRSLYDLYIESCLDWKIQKKIFKNYKKKKIEIFTSIFCKDSLNFAIKNGLKLIKISSFESSNFLLLYEVVKTGIPIIISTGSTKDIEIEKTISFIKSKGKNDLALLLCVSDYPADAKDYNLSRIKYLKDKYSLPIGISDHTVGKELATAAIGAGATIIEKHVCLEEDKQSIDSHFSLSSDKFSDFCNTVNVIYDSLNKKPNKISLRGRNFRSSLYYQKDLKKGSILKISDFKSVRPNLGLPSENIFKIVGKRLKSSVIKDEPVKLNHLE
jgi:N-acetylneuraminate synthase